MKPKLWWIRAMDATWGVMLAGVLVLWIAGLAEWHQALFMLAPSGMYLAVRHLLVDAAGAGSTATDPGNESEGTGR